MGVDEKERRTEVSRKCSIDHRGRRDPLPRSIDRGGCLTEKVAADDDRCSHQRWKIDVNGQTCFTTIPVHRSDISLGTCQ